MRHPLLVDRDPAHGVFDIFAACQATCEGIRTTTGNPAMSANFTGWKRKTGVVTLLLACVASVWWIESLFYWDQCRVVGRQCFVSVTSTQGQVWLHKHGTVFEWPKRYTLPKLTKSSFRHAPFVAEAAAERLPINTDREGTIRFVGWQYHWVTAEAESVIAVPYWSIVISLAAVSVWSLLSRPHFALNLSAITCEPD